MKCRICGLEKSETEFYDQSKGDPADWNKEVCKPCIRSEQSLVAARIRNGRAEGVEALPEEVMCGTCLEYKQPWCFPPSAVASYHLGFLARCAKCDRLRKK